MTAHFPIAVYKTMHGQTDRFVRSGVTSRIALTCVGAIFAGFALSGSGCTGPTRAGLEARAEARDRMSLVNAHIGYDQALRSYEVGQLDRAMREVAASIDRSPNQPEFYVLQGRIYIEKHQLEPALGSLNRAINLAGGFVVDESSRSNSESSKRLTVPPAYPGSAGRDSAQHSVLAQAHYFSGIIRQRWSDHIRAHESYRAASELEPTNVQYLLAAAESLVALERYDEATHIIEPNLAYFEHNSALRQLLGQIALLQGNAERAVVLLTEARLLNPEDVMLLEELARAQFAAHKFGRCLDSLQLLKRMRAAGEGKSFHNSTDGSTTSVSRADLLHLEARCLVMLDRPIEARRVYLELTELEGREVEPWIELGAVSYTISDMRRLASSAARVVALAPDRWEGPFLQALYELRMAEGQDQQGGGSDRAVRLLRQAANRAAASGSPLPHLVLGQVLEKRGDNAAAMAAYDHAKRIDPNDQHALELLGGISSRLSAVPVE